MVDAPYIGPAHDRTITSDDEFRRRGEENANIAVAVSIPISTFRDVAVADVVNVAMAGSHLRVQALVRTPEYKEWAAQQANRHR
eukprot:COSAG02_NODE_3696_length_6372_cov_2.297306_3_plen_84_part_00